MDQQLADSIAMEYERWSVTSDRSRMTHFSPDLFDHVSGQRGLRTFDLVGGWLNESFADRRVEHHATMFDDERVMVWYTTHARHVGNGFPRMAGLNVTGAEIQWPQVHIFRVAGQVVEHWAVRDDFAMLEAIRNPSL